MRVLMLPAGQDVGVNPYTYLLVAALRGCGVEVLSGTRVRDAFSKVDILHVHWPHNYASVRKGATALVASLQFIALCLYHRLRGARIIWTVHNLRSLTPRNEGLEKLLMAAFTRLTGGLIFLNRSSQAELYEERWYMRSLPSAVIPHGVYGDTYPSGESKHEARIALALQDAQMPIIAFPGSIKPYKNLDSLVQAVTALAGKLRITLLIAGRCDPPAHEAQITKLIDYGRAQGAHITWINERQDDVQLARVIDASDVVALPYSTSWNSGMAVLALERGRRLVCSSSKVFREMADEAGPYWIELADPDIASAVARFDVGRPPSEQDLRSLRAFITSRQWPEIGRATAAFYRQIARRVGGRDDAQPVAR